VAWPRNRVGSSAPRPGWRPLKAPGDADRTRADLAGAPYGLRINGRVFDAVDLSSVLMNQLWLERCSFIGADLRHATLDGCHFKLCDFRDATLRSASMRGAGFAGCDFRNADLRDTDLAGARFGYVLTGTDTGRTDLTGTLLAGASLDGALFDNVIGRPEN
jgi:uncharacterized protein YjbI with pentapeptide repeats